MRLEKITYRFVLQRANKQTLYKISRVFLNIGFLLLNHEYKCTFNSVIMNTLNQLCPLADEFKQIRGKTIASKKLAREEGKEEWEELRGMIFSSPPVLSLQKRPCAPALVC